LSHEYEIVNPRAEQLFESLRAFGYDLPTALADIVDNSIAAQARNVWIDLIWKGENSYILIRDDGEGMNEAELVNAMRAGSSSPLEERDKGDLGRFGLGLKTASLSQCRRLTVASKRVRGDVSARCWDLDYVSASGKGEWRLLKGSHLVGDSEKATLSRQAQGTTVFWNKLDRLVGQSNTNDEVAQRFFREKADDVKSHLSMVFHRFLQGRNAITIHLNGRALVPWDPFLEEEAATDAQPEEVLNSSRQEIRVKPYVLPHHSKISAETHAQAAGPRGWNAQQGYYVYRNRRLLVAGDWLGLGMQKEEHYKLARIRLDLSTESDLTWQIDVKKSKARPPSALRADLQRIARAVRSRAGAIYRHRGKVLQRNHSEDHVFVWKSLIKHGKKFYKINRDHPLVRKVLTAEADRSTLKCLIGLLEQTVPAPLIAIHNAEKPDSMGQPYEDSLTELKEAMLVIFRTMVESGKGASDVARSIILMEPFIYHPDVSAAFLEEISSKFQGRIPQTIGE
jgi:hypothetical protein